MDIKPTKAYPSLFTVSDAQFFCTTGRTRNNNRIKSENINSLKKDGTLSDGNLLLGFSTALQYILYSIATAESAKKMPITLKALTTY